MLRHITTLDLPSSTIAELQKKGFNYVEDILNNEEILNKFNLNKSTIEEQLKITGVLALDFWQNEIQRESIPICCSELEAILGGGFQCGTITELSGAPFVGKTQICMQLCISVQLNKHYGGLNGRAIYIDTRSGMSILRLTDLIQGYNNYYNDLNLDEDDALQNIEVYTPMGLEQFLKAIDSLKDEVKIIKNGKKARLIILDSLSLPILCCVDDPIKRPYYYTQILYKLHKLALNHDLAVIITNELITQVDKDGQSYFTAAGGQYVSDYAHVKLELTRLSKDTFATRLIKSPIMPEMTVIFKISADGIRNTS